MEYESKHENPRIYYPNLPFIVTLEVAQDDDFEYFQHYSVLKDELPKTKASKQKADIN